MTFLDVHWSNLHNGTAFLTDSFQLSLVCCIVDKNLKQTYVK